MKAAALPALPFIVLKLPAVSTDSPSRPGWLNAPALRAIGYTMDRPAKNRGERHWQSSYGKHSCRLRFLMDDLLPSAPIPELKRGRRQPNHNPQNPCPDA